MHFQPGPRPDTAHVRRASVCPGILGLVAAIGLSSWPAIDAYAERDIALTIAEAEDLALAAEPGQEALRSRAAAFEEQAVVAGALPDPMLRVGSIISRSSRAASPRRA